MSRASRYEGGHNCGPGMIYDTPEEKEIARLTKERDALRVALEAEKKQVSLWCGDWRKSEDENARLRAALEMIEKGPTLPLSEELTKPKAQAVYVAQWSQEMARKALGNQ